MNLKHTLHCLFACLFLATASPNLFAELNVKQSPDQAGTWGWRPAMDKACNQTPPSFVWQPQHNAVRYVLQIATDKAFEQIAYEATNLPFNAHRPSMKLASHVTYHWRINFTDKQDQHSTWSLPRTFTIATDASASTMPPYSQLKERIPTTHPRLFVRPEQIPAMRELAHGSLNDVYSRMLQVCDDLLVADIDLTEPKRYPKEIERKSPAWKKIWWGNRIRTEAVLKNAAVLGFAWQLSQDSRYGNRAKQLLMAAASWNPRGSTGYIYNDEAGMPYAYFFSRTYSFIHDLLNEDEIKTCQQVMTIRGNEIYKHLAIQRKHLWMPYESHRNRAWHYLGEVAIAFHNEIPQADDWLEFAMTVYSNVYPVWSSDDGGWHEGLSYFRQYNTRFLWFAAVMKSALKVDAFGRPFYAQAGYFPMYLMPPSTESGGFGDCSELLKGSRSNLTYMDAMARQSGNPYWAWYVQAHQYPIRYKDYIGFTRMANSSGASAQSPSNLPTSRLFAGVGLAVMNTNLMDATKNLQVQFKADPFGTQSHGYDAQNSFLVGLYGKRLLIRSGYRDVYGSPHHRHWMWHTQSQNNITVNGQSQTYRDRSAIANITAFADNEHLSFATGNAAHAYPENVQRYTRSVLMIKPQLIVVYDRLQTEKPSSFEYHLHSFNKMKINKNQFEVINAPAACRVDMLVPSAENLVISQTDQFNPPPKIKADLTQYHLTAQTTTPQKTMQFVTLIWPHHADKKLNAIASVEPFGKGYRVQATLPDGSHLTLTLDPTQATGESAVAAKYNNAEGKVIFSFKSEDAKH